ncbi:chemotaxis protein CheA [Pseudoduganella sp. LjRoot289]|uniref:chemotaxis protein CheA n=1 Tax=Pseudoduganella sp. LjRoot289 TaxID=3342314 RepID=UPI003ECC927B
MNLDAALHTYILESRDLLEDMERALLSVGPHAEMGELVDAVFRAVHTIKGSAGLFGLDHVVDFAHVVENVLDRVRAGAVLDEALVALLLACRDHTAALIDALQSGTDAPDPALLAQGAPLLARLRAHLLAGGAPPAAAVPAVAAVAAQPDCRGDGELWHISLRFGEDTLRNGMDPLSVLRYLGQLGSVAGIVTLSDAMPAPALMDPEACYLGFEIAFSSAADKAAIDGVFDFVRGDCAIRILAPESRLAEYVQLIEALPEDNARLGEILVRCGSVTERELAQALQAQHGGAAAAAPLGAMLVEMGAVRPPVVEAALAKQERARQPAQQENRSIRIDADKLDHLINLIGELIIVGAGANVAAARVSDAELQERTSTLAALVEQVRDSALQLRMVKIGATLNRFQRVVHDVSREIGKDIALLVRGGDTELDKTVVERIGDPLTHLVRNAIDHGIEPAGQRIACGKPARGTVELNAYHDAGCIVIEVRDDGGGLQRDKILAKALERGLVEPGRKLSDGEVYGLIFAPGFSTAEQVTQLSGRGVGMDVVKRNIDALRGTVAVASEAGAGTTIALRLPLTLAMIDGFLVTAGKSMFVIPLDMIEECLAFDAGADAGRGYTSLRGRVLPCVRLRELFGVAGEPARRENVVVVKHGGQRWGLVVDGLLGEFQTVIKPLGKLFQQVRCISGSTILGSGEVALILDMAALMAVIEGRAQAAAMAERETSLA